MSKFLLSSLISVSQNPCKIYVNKYNKRKYNPVLADASITFSKFSPVFCIDFNQTEHLEEIS